MMINEVNELRLRRVYPELRSLIQYFLGHSHPCDFVDSEHFFYGIKDEIFDDGFWLEYNLDWEDIEFALLEYFREMIENHYNYECQSRMNDELTEYPNFVYESEDNVKFRRRYSVSDEYLWSIVNSLGDHSYLNFNNLYRDVVNELVNQLEGISMEEREKMGEMYLTDKELKKKVKEYYNKIHPNFVYESTEDLPNKIKRRLTISDETWKDVFDSVDVMDYIDFDGWYEQVLDTLAYVDNLEELSFTELDQVISYFEKDSKVLKMAQEYYIQKLSPEKTPYAVFEITKPLAHMPLEYYYQEAPLWKTKEGIIYIKKGAAGHKSISTNNIKVLKVFPEGETEEMYKYLDELRSKLR